MQNAARSTAFLCIALLLCLTTGSCLPKAKPATVKMPDGQTIESQRVRIWIYELTNSLVGQVELAMNKIMQEDSDPQVRRAALEWKASAVPALQRASFHSDPVVALTDLWLLVVQVQLFAQSERGRELSGDQHAFLIETVDAMEETILQFIRDHGGNPIESGGYDLVHTYAAAHPIRNSVSTRPSAAAALVDRVRSGKMGAFAAVGSLVESLGDLSDRLAIYGEQLPKQARWQAEILLWDKGLEAIDVDALLADTARLGRAADHLVEFSDGVPALIDERVEELVPRIEGLVDSIDLAAIEDRADAMIAAHLAVALTAVTREREAAIEAVHEERLDAFGDAEVLANEIVDRSFERVETMIDASLSRLIPVGILLMVGVFVLGLVAGMVFRRRPARA